MVNAFLKPCRKILKVNLGLKSMTFTNSDISQVIVFSGNKIAKDRYNMNINNTQIKSKGSINFLWTEIDNKLNLEKHAFDFAAMLVIN